MKDIQYIHFKQVQQGDRNDFTGCDIYYRESAADDYDKLTKQNISRAEILKALQLATDFEFLKDLFNVNCLVDRSSEDRSLLHLLKNAQQVIELNCQLIKQEKPPASLSNIIDCVNKVQGALRRFQ